MSEASMLPSLFVQGQREVALAIEPLNAEKPPRMPQPLDTQTGSSNDSRDAISQSAVTGHFAGGGARVSARRTSTFSAMFYFPPQKEHPPPFCFKPDWGKRG